MTSSKASNPTAASVTPYEAGAAAFACWEPVTACPHAPFSSEALEWMRGFDEAEVSAAAIDDGTVST